VREGLTRGVRHATPGRMALFPHCGWIAVVGFVSSEGRRGGAADRGPNGFVPSRRVDCWRWLRFVGGATGALLLGGRMALFPHSGWIAVIGFVLSTGQQEGLPTGVRMALFPHGGWIAAVGFVSSEGRRGAAVWGPDGFAPSRRADCCCWLRFVKGATGALPSGAEWLCSLTAGGLGRSAALTGREFGAASLPVRAAFRGGHTV
jgi:hypothetical protein